MNGCPALVKVDLKFVQAVAAKGRTYHYFRKAGMPRERLPGQPGDRAFMLRYGELVRQSDELPTRPEDESLAGIIMAYKGSPEYRQLKPKTQTDYGRYLDRLSMKYGDLRVKQMPRAFVFGLRDEYAATPRTANYMVQVLRIVMGYAMDRGLITTNPAARPRLLRTGEGHEPWEEAEIETFRAAWPIDTVERVAFELLLYTGQRGGDTIAMSRQDYRAGWIKVVQEKTRAKLEVPAAAALERTLASWLAKHNHLVILIGRSGRPLKKDRFRHMMARAYEKAELVGKTTHGLRYTAATRLREVGCDWETIGAITGHKTAEMARKYAAKRRLAQIGIERINEAERTKRD
jgi:integrase